MWAKYAATSREPYVRALIQWDPIVSNVGMIISYSQSDSLGRSSTEFLQQVRGGHTPTAMSLRDLRPNSPR
jgi:hypothetical protein